MTPGLTTRQAIAELASKPTASKLVSVGYKMAGDGYELIE
jgi:hypothetical protein